MLHRVCTSRPTLGWNLAQGLFAWFYSRVKSVLHLSPRVKTMIPHSVERVYETLALYPGHSQTLARSCGDFWSCKIKSGSGLGTRLMKSFHTTCRLVDSKVVTYWGIYWQPNMYYSHLPTIYAFRNKHCRLY